MADEKQERKMPPNENLCVHRKPQGRGLSAFFYQHQQPAFAPQLPQKPPPITLAILLKILGYGFFPFVAVA